jgi:hypothetical protein
MTRVGALALALVLATPRAVTAAPPAPAASLPPLLGALPSIPRVRIDVTSDHLVVTEDVNLPRGEWRSGELAFYVAFGAPGAPVAFDARLLAVPDGALEPDDGSTGERVAIELAPRRPGKVYELIGPEEMAGAVVRVPEATFRRAAAPGGMAVLRLRTLLRLPAGDARTGHEVLVRLGKARTTPLTLGQVRVASIEDGKPIARAEARLCGEDADPWPLAVSVEPKTSAASSRSQASIAPVLAVRHAKDDLCVRFWLRE